MYPKTRPLNQEQVRRLKAWLSLPEADILRKLIRDIVVVEESQAILALREMTEEQNPNHLETVKEHGEAAMAHRFINDFLGVVKHGGTEEKPFDYLEVEDVLLDPSSESVETT